MTSKAKIAEYGHAMAALSERQRKFVMALINYPGIRKNKAAELAGYQNSPGGMRVVAHHLTHNLKIQAALREEAGKRLGTHALRRSGVLLQQLIDDESAPSEERTKAAIAAMTVLDALRGRYTRGNP
jgi:hypothetical protein